MSPVALAISVWALTIVSVVVVLVERKTNKRFLGSVRGYVDVKLDVFFRSTKEQVPGVNQEFVRQFFHYMIHVFLSIVLRVVRRTEKILRAIVRFNRKKAIERVERDEDTYLEKIAAHKEEVALSSKEKKHRKDAALRGEI